MKVWLSSGWTRWAVTFVLVKIVEGVIGLRVTAEDEQTGLDISLHNETGFKL